MLEGYFSINGKSLAKVFVVRKSSVMGTDDTWFTYEYRIYESLADKESPSVFQGEVIHKKEDGFAILMARVLTVAYGGE
jgi:hypothetical protein